jgi:hypothetical protein
MSEVVDLDAIKTQIDSVLPITPEIEKSISNLSVEYDERVKSCLNDFNSTVKLEHGEPLDVLSRASRAFDSFDKYRNFILGMRIWGAGIMGSVALTLGVYHLSTDGPWPIVAFFPAYFSLLFTGDTYRLWRTGEENIRKYGRKNVTDAFYKLLKKSNEVYKKLHLELPLGSEQLF